VETWLASSASETASAVAAGIWHGEAIRPGCFCEGFETGVGGPGRNGTGRGWGLGRVAARYRPEKGHPQEEVPDEGGGEV